VRGECILKNHLPLTKNQTLSLLCYNNLHMVYYFLRTFISGLSKLAMRCKVEGKSNLPKHSACIVVANHVNLLDSPMLGVSLGRKVYFLAKAELWDSRIIGWLVGKFGAVAVAKGRINRRAGRTALELLSDGEALIIYPEGKRSENGQLGQAYPGAALLAVKSNVLLVPVGVIGTRQLTGKWWFLRRPKITLKIGQPFTLSASSDKPGKEETAQMTHEIMLHIAELLPREYRGEYGS
jgi:1-acyl-sn-glycerol-3-phosphate acyltransferase